MKPQPKTRVECARHVAEREAVTGKALDHFGEMNKRFAALSLKGVNPMILEAARLDALASYEAVLDSIRTERDALTMLEAARRADPRRGPSGSPPPKKT